MIPLSLLRKVDRWLRDHALVWCARCRYLMFAKNAHYRIFATGQNLPLCSACEKELYHPFGG